MKKKLLSLVLAGAMVASTSVSAFATSAPSAPSEIYEATGGDTYSFTGEKDANININGNIADSGNLVKPSTISVTVPTAAKFTVNSDGKLIGSNIHITSQSDTSVEVIAYKFVDPTKDSDINAVSLDALNNENSGSGTGDRKKVYLTLSGDEGSVSLQSEQGVCGLKDTNTVNDTVLGKVGNGKSLKLSLDGSGVTTGNKLTSPISDTFTLTLKLKKANS